MLGFPSPQFAMQWGAAWVAILVCLLVGGGALVFLIHKEFGAAAVWAVSGAALGLFGLYLVGASYIIAGFGRFALMLGVSAIATGGALGALPFDLGLGAQGAVWLALSVPVVIGGTLFFRSQDGHAHEPGGTGASTGGQIRAVSPTDPAVAVGDEAPAAPRESRPPGESGGPESRAGRQ